jgi:hypothetical protein
MRPELLERVRGFQKERLAAIGGGWLPIPLENLPGTIVVHIAPFGAFALGGHRVSGADLQAAWDTLRPDKVMGGYSPRINFDGLLVWAPWQKHAVGYVQAYRNGIVESVSRDLIIEVESPGALLQVIWSPNLEINTTRLVLGQLGYLKRLGFSEPFVRLVALLGTAAARVDHGPRVASGSPAAEGAPIGRDEVIFDEVVVEETPRDEQAAARLLRPIFDQLANAGGRATSQHFAPDGSWKLRTGA